MIILINCLILAAIALRVLLFCKEKHRYSFKISALAYAVYCASAAACVFSLMQHQSSAIIAQTCLNFMLLLLLARARGNIKKVDYL